MYADIAVNRRYAFSPFSRHPHPEKPVDTAAKEGLNSCGRNLRNLESETETI